MYLICHSKIGNSEVAREIIQDIFKSIWERKDSINLNSSVENYLMGALKLKIIDHFRTEISHQKHLKCIFEDYCEQDNCTENSVGYNELQNKVNQLVDTLPCQCKNVYKLNKEQGLSIKQIASKLLISERAVTYHLTKATSFLKEELTEYNF